MLVIFTAVNNVRCNLVNLNNSNTSENENLTSQLLTCDDDDGKCKEIHRDHLLLVQKFDVRSSSIYNGMNDNAYRSRLKHSSVIYGLLTTASENQLNQKCHKEITRILHGIHKREVWAMKSEFECKFYQQKSISCRRTSVWSVKVDLKGEDLQFYAMHLSNTNISSHSYIIFAMFISKHEYGKFF